MVGEIVGLVAGLVSLILGGVAIAISVYFYTQAKNTEKEVAGALEGIRAQTDALQKIVARQMTQLIRGVTTQQPNDFSLVQQMIGAIKDIPVSVITLMQTPPPSSQAAQAAQYWRTEAINGYMGAYFFAAITNISNQYFLPPLEQLQPEDIFRKMVDGSHDYFFLLDQWFSGLDDAELRPLALYALYRETVDLHRMYVKDTTTVYAERAATTP